MKDFLGHIPEEIVYIYAGPQTVSCYFLLEKEEEIEQSVVPIFIADNKSAGQIKTGEKWATKLGGQISKIVRKNEPFSDIKILNLEIRSQGGRAYKGVDADGYYFDIREDVILDTMLNKGIKKEGVLPGTFIWGQIGSQIKLVRVNSELHKALIRANKRKSLDFIPNKKLEPGGVYQDKSGYISVFIGDVKTLFLPYDQPVEKITDNGYQKRKLFTNGQIDLSKKDCFEQSMLSNQYIASQFNFLQSHTFVQKIDQLTLSDDFITKLRKETLKKVLFDLKRGNERSLRNHLSFNSGMAHMHRADEDLPETPEYLKLLTLS